jgi:N-acetylmuramoyl-L-alanine amidase
MRIVISSGHGLHVRGAEGIIDEVDEARKVVESVAAWARIAGNQVVVFHDDTSTTQGENLDAIVNFHNSQDRDVDVSVHFNDTEGGSTVDPIGTEVWYLTQPELAARVAGAISKAGDLINRGAKYTDGLAFLNGTDEPAILIEVCFVDSEADVTNYRANYDAICEAIGTLPPYTNKPGVVKFEGKCSWFGGPDDDGVDEDEGLAFLYEYEDAPHLFLDEQPEGTTGLARRLDPEKPYVACRWDYDVTPKEMLADRSLQAIVRNKVSGTRSLAWPADWGPHESTGRAADLSPGLLDALDLDTDDEVQVIYPARKDQK